jgi:hypothetical protein
MFFPIKENRLMLSTLFTRNSSKGHFPRFTLLIFPFHPIARLTGWSMYTTEPLLLEHRRGDGQVDDKLYGSPGPGSSLDYDVESCAGYRRLW